MTTPLANLTVTAVPDTTSSAMLSGSFIDAGGNAFSSYVTATIKNSQSTDTPANFQQLLNISSPPGANTDWSNVAFALNGNELHSWVESQGSPSRIWVLLPDGIAAGKSITINIWVGASSVSWDSFRGEAPQLSTVYGEHDNGADVFSKYWNFSGTALPTGWETTAGFSGSVNNGLTLASSVKNAGAYYAMTLSNDIVVDGILKETAHQSLQTIFSESTPVGGGTIPEIFGTSGNGYVASIDNGGTGGYSMEVFKASTGTTLASGTQAITLDSEYRATFLWNGTSLDYSLSGTSLMSATDSTYSSLSYLYLGVYNRAEWVITSLFLRSAPPNSVMPSVTANYPATITGTTDSNGKITMNLYNVKYTLKFSGDSLLQPYTVTLNPPANATFTLYKLTNKVKSGYSITVGGVTIGSGSSVWIYGGEGLAISVSDPNFVQWVPSSAFKDSTQASTTLYANLTSDLSVNYSYYKTTTVDITSSETYTVPAGSTIEQVNMWGGGGAGAGSTTGTFGTGGGGSGGNLAFTLSIGAGTSIPITIGEGGNEGNSAFCGAIVGGGNGGSLNGPAGSSTIFGSPGDPYYAVAGGGAGGLSGSGGAGGAGGTNTPPTGSGISISTNTSNPGSAGATAAAVGGAGGAGSSGSGGSPAANTPCPNATPLYGAGGAGAGNANGDSMGGYGTNGIVTLTVKELVS